MASLRLLACAAAVAVTCSLGCAGGGPQLAEVEGAVKVKGKPLGKIHVEFWPAASGPRSIGITDDQGRFTLTTDDGTRQGAVVGSHRVVLRDVGIFDTSVRGRAAETVDLTKGRKPRISNKYGDATMTPIKKEVTVGKNTIELDVLP